MAPTLIVDKEIVTVSQLAWVRYSLNDPIMCSSTGLEILPLGYAERDYERVKRKVLLVRSRRIPSALAGLLAAGQPDECLSFHYLDAIENNALHDARANYRCRPITYPSLRFWPNNSDNSFVCWILGRVSLEHGFLDTAEHWFSLGVKLSYQYRNMNPTVIYSLTHAQFDACKEKYYPECMAGLGEYYCRIRDRGKAIGVFVALAKLTNDKGMASAFAKVLNASGFGPFSKGESVPTTE